MVDKDSRLTEDDFKMMEEEENKDNLFNGFGGDKDDKKANYKIYLSVAAVVVVLGVFIYLISALVGTDGPTTMAVVDLSEEELAAVQENQQALEELGIEFDTGSDVVGADGTVGDGLGEDGLLADEPVLEHTTITTYLGSVNKILGLRTASKESDTIKVAEFVADLDLYLDGLEDSTDLIRPWQKIIACAYSGCDDAVFVNFIDAVATQDMTNVDHKTIHALVETFNYWDGKNTVLFSHSLKSTNKLVVENYNSETISKWNEMIRCNGACENSNDLLFEMIGLIIV